MPDDRGLPDIYFLPEWRKLFEEHDRGESGVFEYRGKKGSVYYPYMKRPLPEDLECRDHVDLVTPYGFNGPVILACPGGDRKGLVADFDEAFQAHCLQERIVSEYVRFSPWLKNHEDFAEIYELKYNNYTLFTNLTGEDFFMEEFSSKTRNQVRKAQKSGVGVEFDFDGKGVGEFSRIYRLTASKNRFSDYYMFREDFLEKSFQVLRGRQFILNALYEGRCVSSAIFLLHGDFVHYHLCANDPAHYSLCANSLLLFEAAKWAKANRMKQLHLGGAFTKELFAFKKQFTKSPACDYYVGKKIRDGREYQKLLERRKTGRGVSVPGYFPLYRG